MDRYQRTFQLLASRTEGAFVPFTVLGDPDPGTSLAVLEAFVAGGADMLELGIPFSDPVADGPVIQGADLRALRAGTTPESALAILHTFRKRHPSIPVGLLVYANLVQRGGREAAFRRFARSGVDSVLIADVPPEEAAPFRRAATGAAVGSVSMVTPLTTNERLGEITALSGPYLYVVSRAGVTGKDASLSTSAAQLLRRIRRVSSIPTLLGFGISRPDHVRQAIAAGASGAISGSAAVEIIARYANGKRISTHERGMLVKELVEFTATMKAGTR